MKARGLRIGVALTILGVIAQGAMALPAARIDAQTHVLLIAEDNPRSFRPKPRHRQRLKSLFTSATSRSESCMDRWDAGHAHDEGSVASVLSAHQGRAGALRER